MDTDTGQLLSVTPIAGHTALSEISANFEQDVIETLKTTIGINESIIWGCDFAGLSRTPPFIFGYLIITSRQLIRVQFVSDIERKVASSAISLLLNPLIFLIKELFGVYEKSAHPWAGAELPTVPYPSQPITPNEKNSRRMIANDLENLTSVRPITSWHKEVLINSLVVGFHKDNEFTITFYSPHQAEKTYQLLVSRPSRHSSKAPT